MVGPQKYYKPLPCHPRARFMGSLPVGFWMTSGLPLISYDYYIFAALDCVFPPEAGFRHLGIEYGWCGIITRKDVGEGVSLYHVGVHFLPHCGRGALCRYSP